MSARKAIALLPHTRDPAEWTRRHALGEVPGKTFYSLENLDQHGYSVVPVAGDGRIPARAISRLGNGFDWSMRLGDASDADVLLAWSETSGVPAALRRRRPPLATGVIWLTDRTLPRATSAAVAKGLARAEAVWALSRAQLAVLHDRWGVENSRLHFLPFGVDTTFWRESSIAVERDPRLVVSIGNDRHRDFDSLLAGFRAARRERPDLRLELVTASDLQLHIGEKQHDFLTHTQIRSLYERASVVVVALRPNYHVSGMTVALEAAAMGVPVIMTRTAGVDDYVLDKTTGMLVEQDNPGAIAQALSDLLDEPALGAGLGANARAYVRAEHSAQTQARALAAILDPLM